MAQTMICKENILRGVAISLILVSVSFSLPEARYSVDKTFVKSPPPQSEIVSFMADDLEDTDDVTPGFLSVELTGLDFCFLRTSYAETDFTHPEKVLKTNPIYLVHRKWLI